MYSDLRILIKVVAFSFYQRNAGLFLVAFLLLVGIFPPHILLSSHLAIANALTQSPQLLLVAIIAWFLYGTKCLQHTTNVLSTTGNEVLHYIELLPVRRKVFSISVLYLLLYLPILAYSLLAIILSIQSNRHVSAITIISFNLLMAIVFTYAVEKRIALLKTDAKYLKLFAFFDIEFRKNYPSFFWAYLLKNNLVPLAISKSISIILIVLAEVYYLSSHEIRILRIGFALSVFSHALLVQQLRQFEDNRMLFTRNLPFSYLHRFGNYALVYFVIIILEITILLKYAFAAGLVFSFLEYGCFAVAFCLLCHSYLFYNDVETSKYVRKLFYFFIVCLLVIMYKVSLFIISIPMGVIAYILLRNLYYRYES